MERWCPRCRLLQCGVGGFEADPPMKLPGGLCADEGNSAEGTENGGRCPIW
ncbi:hypothetical protein IC582_009784 [Cucumis melo]